MQSNANEHQHTSWEIAWVNAESFATDVIRFASLHVSEPTLDPLLQLILCGIQRLTLVNTWGGRGLCLWVRWEDPGLYLGLQLTGLGQVSEFSQDPMLGLELTGMTQRNHITIRTPAGAGFRALGVLGARPTWCTHCICRMQLRCDKKYGDYLKFSNYSKIYIATNIPQKYSLFWNHLPHWSYHLLKQFLKSFH